MSDNYFRRRKCTFTSSENDILRDRHFDLYGFNKYCEFIIW